MAFTLHKAAEGTPGVVVLALHGKSDLAIHEANPFPFESFLGEEWKAFVVLLDMSGINYLDSQAVGWLIASQKSFRGAGGQLILHSLQSQVHQLLAMLKLERVVPMAGDLATARKCADAPVAVAR